jgi:hypothetical protein
MANAEMKIREGPPGRIPGEPVLRKEEKKMKKGITILIAVAFFSVMSSSALYAMGSSPKEKVMTRSEVTHLIGTEVKNPSGQVLGSIRDFVFDTNGQVLFAVLSYENKSVAIPYRALSISSATKPEEIVLNADKEKLDGAPAFDRQKAATDREWAADVYRYFGQQPYWTEEKAQPATPPGPGGVGY